MLQPPQQDCIFNQTEEIKAQLLEYLECTIDQQGKKIT